MLWKQPRDSDKQRLGSNVRPNEGKVVARLSCKVDGGRSRVMSCEYARGRYDVV